MFLLIAVISHILSQSAFLFALFTTNRSFIGFSLLIVTFIISHVRIQAFTGAELPTTDVAQISLYPV